MDNATLQPFKEPKLKEVNQTPVNFPSKKLDAALFRAADTFIASTTQFFLLDETCKSAKAGKLEGDKVKLGITCNWFDPTRPETQNYQHLLFFLTQDYPKVEVTDNAINWEFQGVPVEVQIIRGNYSLLKNLDQIRYLGEPEARTDPEEYYYTPNPLPAYFDFLKEGNIFV